MALVRKWFTATKKIKMKNWGSPYFSFYYYFALDHVRNDIHGERLTMYFLIIRRIAIYQKVSTHIL